MSPPRPALACALGAAVLAATAVADQRIGLALTLTLLLVIAAGLLGAQRRPSRVVATLAAALAVQPLLRDAGWVVTADVTAALVAAAMAVGNAGAWAGVVRALLAPWRLVRGMTLAAGWARTIRPAGPEGQLWPALRGAGLAVVLIATFGALFASADSAFAGLIDTTFGNDLDPADLAWRLALAVLVLATGGAIARAGDARAADARLATLPVPGRTELVIALAALVALFATFVAVQLRVLFGGAAYVRATTGLGYGDYARQGFTQLLLVAALTLAVVAVAVAVAARRRDRTVRALLGCLCVLTLVVLLSAHHRLDLVEQAYGFTRVRFTGHAVVLWLAALFGLLLAVGVAPAVGRRLPQLATTLTLAGVLVFSLSNPDGRIAQRAVDRAAGGRPLDTLYLTGLSADAVPALEGLPPRQRGPVLRALGKRLARPDGIAGLNLARACAR
jgi:hypothetical protein